MKLADRGEVRVTVPATSANLGPGFDALGLALELRDEISVQLADQPISVTVTGHGAGVVPTDETHLVARAIQATFDYVGAPSVGFKLHCHNRIPHGRGLGSSAAAVVAGITAARNLLVEPAALTDDEALMLATRFEGHPDNAAPALLGGFTVAWSDANGMPNAVRLPVADLEPVVLIPAEQCATSDSRNALPATVPHADAAHSAGRAALLVHALASAPELLLPATEDRLHQPYRARVMPDTMELLERLRAAGAAAVMSGAGPSVLVLTAPQNVDVAALAGESWLPQRAAIARTGAQLSTEP